MEFYIKVKGNDVKVKLKPVDGGYSVEVDGEDLGHIWRANDGEVNHWDNLETLDDYYEDYYKPIQAILDEEFKIQLAGEELTVKPLPNVSFDIFIGSKFIGNLIPQIKDDLTNEWLSADLIGYDYAQQIGELITEREL